MNCWRHTTLPSIQFVVLQVWWLMLITLVTTHTHTHTHTHRFYGHFAGEPGLADCPLDNMACWSDFTGGMPFFSPSQQHQGIIILTRSVQPKPPAVAIVHQNGLSSCQLQGHSHCDTRDTADLVDPGGRWPTTGTSPFLQWSLAVCQSKASKHWEINGHKFLQATGCPAYCRTNIVNALKVALITALHIFIFASLFLFQFNVRLCSEWFLSSVKLHRFVDA